MIRILVLEDDERLNHVVCSVLNDNGYETLACLSAQDGYDAFADNIIDLIVSDIMMPGIDGFEFARQVRQLNKTIPILFMTARDDISAKQKGFSLGIDDYMVKPVDLAELGMRVAALLRRANIENDKRLTVGNLLLNADEMSATIDDEVVPISVKEFNIIYKLLSYPKKTFTRQQLKDEFWGVDTDSTPRTVDVYINKLRDKFDGCDGFEIVTVHGLGYKAILT